MVVEDAFVFADMTRRALLKMALAATAAGGAKGTAEGNGARRGRPCILLRSSWQVVNIGDIAHTPGVVALIEKYIPEADVILWASPSLTDEVAAMEHRRFPKLQIVKGRIGADGSASTPELARALDRATFLLHGSGPSLVAEKDVASFVKHVGKPFGVYGITLGETGKETRELLSQADFVFFRDSVSLAKAKKDGVVCPVMEFGPDGAFAVDLVDDESARSFLKANQLEKGKFVCCIPRLRYTPYWRIKEWVKRDPQRHARNELMKESDHAPLREAITAVIRETDMKVLVCPEDMTQMEVGKENLIEKLPADVLKRVVWRSDFWLTDEALSTYKMSAGLFGLEMHSPIMCIGNGIPAIVCRVSEQTSKGVMWRDIGLDDWLFDMDNPDEVARLTPTVLRMIQDPESAREKVKGAMVVVAKRQAETMAVLRTCLEGLG